MSRFRYVQTFEELVGSVTVALEYCFEVAEELFGPGSLSPKSKIKHHHPLGSTILPKIGLMILPSDPLALHSHQRFIGLDLVLRQ
jgi:hypothetical protein